jgi:uncharacterized protein
MLIYVHGFNSSPASAKAELLRKHLQSLGRADELVCPALPHMPLEAAAVLEHAVAGQDPEAITLIGSSLGGYLATWLVERRGFRAVLLNPVVKPYELFEPFRGPQTNLHTAEQYELTSRHLDQLRALEVSGIADPTRYLLLVTTGDEVLDYRRAVERYRGAAQIVVSGGDHGFSNFRAYLDVVMHFAEGLPT